LRSFAAKKFQAVENDREKFLIILFMLAAFRELTQIAATLRPMTLVSPSLSASSQTHPACHPTPASQHVPQPLALEYWRCLHSQQGVGSIHAVALRYLLYLLVSQKRRQLRRRRILQG
jgi:hypothetical protein